ncbi:hypothetical protein PIB30_041231 [Stylosanthes scabra]|uniref:F-box domain-containing protein n=1 Tax=Stylosanthes scabra TaxID=79078 RepID=A0ABU6SGI2_9FABA|nr:hypothetical protein [Stylosanthes scabra]
MGKESIMATQSQKAWYTNPLLKPTSCNTGTRNWLDLPYDMTLMLMTKVGAFHILNSAQQVCKQWRGICMDPFLWRTIEMCNLGFSKHEAYYLPKMCRHSIDRSNGRLLDIEIQSAPGSRQSLRDSIPSVPQAASAADPISTNAAPTRPIFCQTRDTVVN